MQLPGPVRAVVGLLATAADEAKHLPDRAVELPMLAVSSALQMSLRAQQRYARLAARGDDVINRRSTTDEPPPWATFDDPVSVDDLRSATLDGADPESRARAASALLDELLGTEAPAPAPTAEPPGRKAPVKKAPTKNAPAQKAPAKKAPAKTTVAKKSPAANAGKTISAPRHTDPSPFDTVDDD
jgi:hypothetical protein